MTFEKDERNRINRIPDRGHYDRETVYKVLDDGFLCHLGICVNDQPFVIPTLYGRDGDAIYLHGAPASRLLKQMSTGIPVCLSVAHLDGLVLARSAFHHSANYRSVVLFGTAHAVPEEEKEHGLLIISEQVLRGRWDESRAPHEKELRATSVLRMKIDSASAKIRTGPPKDEPEDHDLPVWAGVVPMHTTYSAPIPDPALRDGIDVPASVTRIVDPAERTDRRLET